MWRRLSAALSLFLLSPLIAEYLLGSLPMSMIGILPLMAMMYGSGAILIREWARRTGHGWPSIVLLATAYGLLEEGFVTQSLFNPNYLHLRLIDFGFVPTLGTALPWLVFVVSIHVAWSISVPIALTETLFKTPRETPWLGKIGLGVFTVLFLASLGAGSALMLLQQFAGPKAHWSWQACVAAVVGLEVAFIAFMVLFTRGKAWSDVQRFALMAGGLFVYVWVGFGTDISLHGMADIPVHAVIAGAFVILCTWAGIVSLRKAGTST